mmetsp:Transcript_17918/g.61563  ORF Transcript_17918/g.61563 Transcript_17918/m.61563 type:complete len:390 (+) Transcript_17918:737-1906(+)
MDRFFERCHPLRGAGLGRRAQPELALGPVARDALVDLERALIFSIQAHRRGRGEPDEVRELAVDLGLGPDDVAVAEACAVVVVKVLHGRLEPGADLAVQSKVAALPLCNLPARQEAAHRQLVQCAAHRRRVGAPARRRHVEHLRHAVVGLAGVVGRPGALEGALEFFGGVLEDRVKVHVRSLAQVEVAVDGAECEGVALVKGARRRGEERPAAQEARAVRGPRAHAAEVREQFRDVDPSRRKRVKAGLVGAPVARIVRLPRRHHRARVERLLGEEGAEVAQCEHAAAAHVGDGVRLLEADRRPERARPLKRRRAGAERGGPERAQHALVVVRVLPQLSRQLVEDRELRIRREALRDPFPHRAAQDRIKKEDPIPSGETGGHSPARRDTF